MTDTAALFELDDLQEVVDKGRATPAQIKRASDLIALFNASPRLKRAMESAVTYHQNPAAVADDLAQGKSPAWIAEANAALAEAIK